jgi:hypothetical protein
VEETLFPLTESDNEKKYLKFLSFYGYLFSSNKPTSDRYASQDNNAAWLRENR